MKGDKYNRRLKGLDKKKLKVRRGEKDKGERLKTEKRRKLYYRRREFDDMSKRLEQMRLDKKRLEDKKERVIETSCDKEKRLEEKQERKQKWTRRKD